jgi:XTP/dITP diphosphohydrolase
MTIYAATTNAGKLREILLARSEAGITGVEIVPLPGLRDLPAPLEDGATFEENATLKALYYSRHSTAPLLAEDSGLEVEALGGAPGIRSARFAGESATDAENNERLLKDLKGASDRRARYVSVVVLAQDGKVLSVARGTVEGQMLEVPRGNEGFGYDPLFFYPPFGCTFGEAPPSRKFQVSHRGTALRSLFRNLDLTTKGDT